MKLIIDIDESLLEGIKSDDFDFARQVVRSFQGTIASSIANGTPIPDNDCNNCEKAWTDKCERAECYENNYKHWTPYQKGSKE